MSKFGYETFSKKAKVGYGILKVGMVFAFGTGANYVMEYMGTPEDEFISNGSMLAIGLGVAIADPIYHGYKKLRNRTNSTTLE